MSLESEPRQLNKEGKLGPLVEICLVAALRIFRERQSIDTNPHIVQMIFRGELIDHWYYRSDQWVDQPYYEPATYLQPYSGPAHLAMPLLYGEGTYVIDNGVMEMIDRGLV